MVSVCLQGLTIARIEGNDKPKNDKDSHARRDSTSEDAERRLDKGAVGTVGDSMATPERLATAIGTLK